MNSPVQEIKDRLDVADVVGSYIKLQKAGVNFKALCPFHSEKTSSFYVTPSRQIWHCFGCGKGGDIFEFVKEIESVDFVESLRLLAHRAGVQLQTQDPRVYNERARLFEILEEATKLFEQNLQKNEFVKKYLSSRGLEDESINAWRLGYASGPPAGGWRGLFDTLVLQGYKPAEIEKAGLIVKRQPAVSSQQLAASYYDRFRNRIIFPVADSSGRIVGFGGRIFDQGVAPVQGWSASGGKYINSPETPVYKKSQILYGFDKAKTEIRKKDSCILVEGYMDAILSHQAGHINTVAVSGTALTRDHLTFIRRLTTRIFIAFDADSAGQDATKRSLNALLSQEFDVRIIHLPADEDPADIVAADANRWSEVVSQARHIIEFLSASIKASSGDELLAKRNVKEIFPFLLSIKSEIERAHWIEYISRVFNISQDALWQDLKQFERSQKPMGVSVSTPQPVKTKNRRSALEEKVLGLLLYKPEYLSSKMLFDDEHFSDERKIIFSHIKDKKNIMDSYELLKDLEQELQLLGKRFSLEAELLCGEDFDIAEELATCKNELLREIAREKLTLLSLRIREAEKDGEVSHVEALINEFNTLSKELLKT